MVIVVQSLLDCAAIILNGRVQANHSRGFVRKNTNDHFKGIE